MTERGPGTPAAPHTPSACASGLWHDLPHWHVLEIGLGNGHAFLATWHAWRQDPRRPQRLSVSATLTQPLPALDMAQQLAQAAPELQPLATELAHAWRGLVPGLHRLVFEAGRVQLTLCIGPLPLPLLREIGACADHIVLTCPPDEPALPKALARLCRSGTHVSAPHPPPQAAKSWRSSGFVLQSPHAQPPAAGPWAAVFAPAWGLRTPQRQPGPAVKTHANATRSVLVLGAGVSGAAVACSLAQRGWAVTVLDAGIAVGAGASGLPVGLTAPHTSPDDHALSRITRAGVRATLQRCHQLLTAAQDWGPSGVLAHSPERKAQRKAPYNTGHNTGHNADLKADLKAEHPPQRLPAHAHSPHGADWGVQASRAAQVAAGLPADAHALWHSMAAWIRPAALASAQLNTPGVTVQWGQQVGKLARTPSGWAARDPQGQTLACASHVVVACGFDSLALLPSGDMTDTDAHDSDSDNDNDNANAKRHAHDTHADVTARPTLPLHALRGQISMGPLAALPAATQALLPPTPVNGLGSFISGPTLPGSGEPGWFFGSTFERDCPVPHLRPQDHADNHAKLTQLLPRLSEPLRAALAPATAQGWAGVRCTLPDRLPAVGPVDAARWPGLHVCTGMGARGLSLSVLCAELLAAHLEAEPLPLPLSLAKHLWAERFLPTPNTASNAP